MKGRPVTPNNQPTNRTNHPINPTHRGHAVLVAGVH